LGKSAEAKASVSERLQAAKITKKLSTSSSWLKYLVGEKDNIGYVRTIAIVLGRLHVAYLASDPAQAQATSYELVQG
jgi:hypothetical protein